MDRQLAERMVGAACLLLVVVLVVPSILDGNRRPEAPPAEPESGEPLDLRTHTLRLDGAERSPPVPQARVPQVAEEAEPVPTAVPATDKTESAPPPGPEVREPPSPPVLAVPPKASAVAPGAGPAPKAQTPPAEQASLPRETSPPQAAGGKDAAGAGEWFVQLGSFSRRDNADRLAAAVTGRGFDAGMVESRGSRGPMYRVRVGPAGSRDAAAALAKKLAGAGYAGQVTRQ